MGTDLKTINTIDLFCGAGGFSKGFEFAGYKILSGIDYNEKLKETYEFNHKKSKFIYYDLLNGVLDDFKKNNIDFIIGSPPCQGFSDARGNRDEKNKSHKSRNSLPFRFIEWVNSLRPEIALMENVSGMATKKYGKTLLLELITDEFKKIGYQIKIGLLNSVYYGVPQERIRVFCLAYKKKYYEILNIYPFPIPNFIPNNFKKRNPKKRTIDLWQFEETNKDFFPIEFNEIRTVNNVITDLPGNPSDTKDIKYESKIPLNKYQEYLRKGMEDKVTLHNILKEPSEEEKLILKNIPEGKIYRSSRFGDRYIGVWDLFNSDLSKIESLTLQFMCRFRTWKEFKTKKGNYTEGYMLLDSFKSYEYMINLMQENGYFNKKQTETWKKIIFNNKFPPPKKILENLYEKEWLRRKNIQNNIAYDINTKSGIRPLYLRLHRNFPSRTIMTTSFKVRELVHPTMNRPITFREGARIQSFPDSFEFLGSSKDIATMIGNAVPPLLAYRLGTYYKDVLTYISHPQKRDQILANLKNNHKLITKFL